MIKLVPKIRLYVAALITAGTVLLSPGSTPADVVSDFGSGAEGWSIVSFSDLSNNQYPIIGAYGVTYNPTGGNPGGYVSSMDPDDGDFTFAAPSAFLGNQSTATGLSYDLIYRDTLNYQTTDVMLVGTNGERLLYESNPVFVPTSNWQTNSLTFSPSGNWHVNTTTGSLATANDFQNVLGSLAGLYIRGEYAVGPDDTGLDNVLLIGATVPEPSSLALCGIASVVGLAIARVRRRRSA